MRSSYTYLAVSIVVFICWWIRVWKVYRAMFSEERLMQFSKRQPVLGRSSEKNKRLTSSKHSIVLYLLPHIEDLEIQFNKQFKKKNIFPVKTRETFGRILIKLN